MAPTSSFFHVYFEFSHKYMQLYLYAHIVVCSYRHHIKCNGKKSGECDAFITSGKQKEFFNIIVCNINSVVSAQNESKQLAIRRVNDTTVEYIPEMKLNQAKFYT